ncbi:hypothetical protein Btru_049799 [Bulinus truncatus]|nr:hypothetical protein Btru_049799 [Bulinus truncatus]
MSKWDQPYYDGRQCGTKWDQPYYDGRQSGTSPITMGVKVGQSGTSLITMGIKVGPALLPWASKWDKVGPALLRWASKWDQPYYHGRLSGTKWDQPYYDGRQSGTKWDQPYYHGRQSGTKWDQPYYDGRQSGTSLITMGAGACVIGWEDDVPQAERPVQRSIVQVLGPDELEISLPEDRYIFIYLLEISRIFFTFPTVFWSAGSIFFRHDENFIGHVYKKVVYREYTDGSFRALKTGSSHDLLGPALTVEVGDTLAVTFRNNARRPYTIHTHGLWTRQEDSGVNYGSSSGVLPGRTHQYVWKIPERAGPGPNDPNCIPWLYYSSVDPVKDTNSGLVGSLVVCRKGVLDERGQRKDVDRELFIFMSVTNENLSWYLEDNVRSFAPARRGTNYQEDEDFVESNKMHSINGRIHGNNNGLVIEYGQRVVWYMMALGAEIDLHTIHLHGHTFVHSSQKHRDDVISIFPGMAEAVEMIADNPGTWLLHCHVSDHIFAGMETVYTVLPPR